MKFTQLDRCDLSSMGPVKSLRPEITEGMSTETLERITDAQEQLARLLLSVQVRDGQLSAGSPTEIDTMKNLALVKNTLRARQVIGAKNFLRGES